MRGLYQNRFFGALTLENIFPLRKRQTTARLLNAAMALSFLPLLYIFLASLAATTPHIIGYKIPKLSLTVAGAGADFWLEIFYLLLPLRLIVFALQAFFNSKTYAKNGAAPNANFYERFNFYAAELFYQIRKTGGTTIKDLLRVLPKTSVGLKTILRLGISGEGYGKFLREISDTEEASDELGKLAEYLEKNVEGYGSVTFKDVIAALFEINKPVRETFMARGLTKEMIRETARWVEEEENTADRERRWWTKERLGRIKGFAKDWAYGHIPHLEKFARDLTDEAKEKAEELIGRDREIKLIEAALLKRAGANVIIVGEPGAGKHTILLGFIKMVAEGKIFPELEHKRVLELYGTAVTSAGKTKGEIEGIFIKILNESVKAGNIILAIDEFPEFVESLSTLGINAVEILSPYLASNSIHILALADTVSCRRILENNAGLMKYFEKIDIGEPGQAELIQILEVLVPETERTYGYKVIITYPALEKISSGAAQYLVRGALPKRAVDLMDEAVKETAERKSTFLTPEMVDDLIEMKTRMPLGEIKIAEQEKLLKLEEFLHKRVVDQEEAIGAIADAVRRARAGIKSPSRPIGTFLFLGPTGVGKTETAKALAEVYFGNEETMLRFDMSEYQNDEDIERLIGSVKTNDPGILASKVRSSPYGVVLLDEFEKSHEKVKNLFLQILDEGFFSDYLGQKVNMRNTIIVATSNAGSQLIWELMEKNIDPSSMERQIIDHIQKEKAISPELLNRFDAVVIFRPLDEAARKEIARLMLNRLALRLEKQNVTLQITEELCAAVVKGGYDPAFGARPMQRFIQDKVEKIISEKIIKGTVGPGSEFSLTEEELK